MGVVEAELDRVRCCMRMVLSGEIAERMAAEEDGARMCIAGALGMRLEVADLGSTGGPTEEVDLVGARAGVCVYRTGPDTRGCLRASRDAREGR